MHSTYTQALHDAEKKLLETSFALMATNSLYITNREQTLDQITEHEALLGEMTNYQATLKDINAKGLALIVRFPSTKDITEKQLENLKASFDSLLSTAHQIKARFLDSLAKFEAYENTLEDISKNLNKWEPEVSKELEIPITNVDGATKRLEYVRVCEAFGTYSVLRVDFKHFMPCVLQSMHNKLQGEKNRLSLAVQEASAAAASLSRPSSPQEAVIQPIPDMELAVRARLEDFIDHVRLICARMSFFFLF
jgi:nesprin-1